MTLGGTAFLIFAATCVRYVLRTSFIVDGVRVFTLWDDAIISMRYARNLVEHGELVWNAGGEHVLGVSNLGVTLLMSLVHLTPVAPEKAALAFQCLNGLFLGGAILLTMLLAEELFGSRTVGMTAALVTAAYAPLTIWSLQGSDAALVALLVVGASLLFVRGSTGWLFVVVGIGVVVRPDFTLASLVFVVGAALASQTRARVLAQGALVLAGVWAALLSCQTLYYGDPLPNTYYLKATGTPLAAMLASGWEQAKNTFSGVALVPLLLLFVYANLFRTRRRAALVLLGALAASLAYTIRIGGDWAVDHSVRFFVPSFPLYITLLVGGSWDLVTRLFSGPVRGWALTVFLGHAGFVIWAINPSAALSELHRADAMPMYRDANQMNYRYARFYCDTTAESATIGVFWAGVTPYFCEREYVDVLGKSDRHIAKLTVDRFSPGHSKWDWRYILDERRPDVLQASTPELRSEDRFHNDYCERRGSLRDLVRHDALHRISVETSLLCTPDSVDACFPCRPESEARTVFDFEGGGLEGWGVAGDAFGPAGVYDSERPLPGQSALLGHRGRYLLNSFHPGDASRARLLSPWFLIDAPMLRFRVGGGRDEKRLYVGLEVEGEDSPVRRATGEESETLRRVRWDVYPFRGRWARLVIADDADGPWGHILVDAVELLR